jgi:hypothetical protein
MSDSIPEDSLIDELFADKVRRAREMPREDKLVEGPRLFDLNCQLMKGAIRSQFPQLSDEQVEKEYDRRLQIARAIDSARIYRDVGLIDE